MGKIREQWGINKIWVKDLLGAYIGLFEEMIASLSNAIHQRDNVRITDRFRMRKAMFDRKVPGAVLIQLKAHWLSAPA
jgi:predicted Rossmann-fold nucleotide-binding protein